MSDKPNPFDLGSAAGPIDQAAFQAAKAAWYADRYRIVNEVLPEVDRTIAELQSWAQVASDALVTLQQLLPVMQAFADQMPQATSASTGPLARLADLKAKLACLTGKC